MPFPGAVNVQPGVGVAGDFCSTNPRASVVNGPGAFVAGSSGVTIGAFAWADSTNKFASNFGPLTPAGFVCRAQQAIIQTFLADNTQQILPGLVVTLFSEGEFWVKNSGASSTAVGQKAYANNATGLVTFAATGNPPAGATSTASTIALNNTTGGTIALPSVTATFSGTTMTVSAVGTGALAPGMVLSGTNVDPATTIVAQLTGTTGSTGTYQVSVSQSVTTATTVTAPLWGVLSLATAVTGLFAPGQTLSGTGVTTGTTVGALISGTGAATGSTLAVFAPTTMAAIASGTSITASGGLLTVGGTVTVTAGSYSIGALLTGSGVTAGTYITANASTNSQLTGAGGAGTYLLNQGQTLSSQAINTNAGTETKWYALSVAAPGELVKMSSWPLG